MGWFARYFISLVVENTTLYRDKYPSIDRETPEGATIGLLEPLDGFTWMPVGQWERVRSVLQLPLESLGFAEEEEERVATRRAPKPTKKPTQKPTTKPTAKPIQKLAPAPNPTEEPPNESSEEESQERQRSKSIDIPEQAPGESLAENAPQDAQETGARLPDSPPDSDEEMVDMPNANGKRQNQEVLNTNVSAYFDLLLYAACS